MEIDLKTISLWLQNSDPTQAMTRTVEWLGKEISLLQTTINAATWKSKIAVAVTVMGVVGVFFLALSRASQKKVEHKETKREVEPKEVKKEEVRKQEESQVVKQEESKKEVESKAGLAKEALKKEEVEQEKVIIKQEEEIVAFDESSFPLLKYGDVLKGVNQDEKPPSNVGIKMGNITSISSNKMLSYAFASVFHTTQSHKEILNFIRSINSTRKLLIQNAWENKYGPIIKLFIHQSVSNHIPHYLYNNLFHLHEKLPGESSEKTVKIYWNERAEKILIPYFLEHENVDIDDLVFMIVEGEKQDNHCQAKEWDPKKQLQFVGIGKEKIFDDLKKEISKLTNEPKEIFYEKSDNPFMDQALYYTNLSSYRDSLLL